MPLPTSHPEQKKEPFGEKIARKSAEQPLVPAFAALTCGALYLAGRALRSGNARLANRMFFYRVMFQGATLVALIGGAYYYGEKYQRSEKSREEKLRETAKQREQLWVEELERIEAESQKQKKQKEDLQKKLKEMQQQSGSEK